MHTVTALVLGFPEAAADQVVSDDKDTVTPVNCSALAITYSTSSKY